MKTIIAENKDFYTLAADEIARLVSRRNDAVLALSAGRTMEGLFEELARRCSAGTLSLAKVRVFAVTEYENVPESLSCRRAILRGLVEKTDLEEENCTFLSGENEEDYDAQIARLGGLDLAVLGLGDNAHIGYNEPATPFDTLTHRQKLTDATKRQNAEVFGSFEAVPDFAWTMGIKTLVSAGEILVLAAGAEKAEPAFRMLYARTDSAVPAAFLQIPLNVTVILDREAAAKI